jgi:hypothetical protein
LLGRKNWLFADSDDGGERADGIYSLIGTAELNGMNIEAYLRHLFERLPEHPINRIEDLLPWPSPINYSNLSSLPGRHQCAQTGGLR